MDIKKKLFANSKESIFSLRSQDFERVALESNPNAGYFFCSYIIAFSPGEYECLFEASFESMLTTDCRVEAVIWHCQSAKIIEQVRWQKKKMFGKTWIAKMSIKTATPTRIELRGYSGNGFAAATFIGGCIRRREGNTGSVSDNLFSWPVQRLKWVVIGTTTICNAVSYTHLRAH